MAEPNGAGCTPRRGRQEGGQPPKKRDSHPKRLGLCSVAAVPSFGWLSPCLSLVCSAGFRRRGTATQTVGPYVWVAVPLVWVAVPLAQSVCGAWFSTSQP